MLHGVGWGQISTGTVVIERFFAEGGFWELGESRLGSISVYGPELLFTDVRYSYLHSTGYLQEFWHVGLESLIHRDAINTHEQSKRTHLPTLMLGAVIQLSVAYRDLLSGGCIMCGYVCVISRGKWISLRSVRVGLRHSYIHLRSTILRDCQEFLCERNYPKVANYLRSCPVCPMPLLDEKWS